MNTFLIIISIFLIGVLIIAVLFFLLRRNVEQSQSLNNQRLETQNNKLLAEVEALSRQLAMEQSDRIRNESNRELKSVIEPLRQHLESFRQIVINSNENEARSRANLQGQIEQLISLNQSIGNDARELARALKGDSKVQGDWGEMQLTTLLEQAGLQRDIHFITQVTRDSSDKVLRDEEGNVRRPDVIVKLPGEGGLIIDSKVSLTAFVGYMNSKDDEERKIFAKKHLDSVRKHIRELAEKNYPRLIQGACDQSVMFMPVEGAFMLALRMDSGLLYYAAERKVAIVSPTHLFSIIQLAAQLWRQDARDRNIDNMAKSAGALYDKLCGFVDDFEKAGRSIDVARRQWEDARSKLITGRGNAISQAEKMRKLGAKTSKRLPEEYTSNAQSLE